MQSEEEKEEKLKMSSLRDSRDTIKCIIACTIKVLEKKGNKGQTKYLKK